MLDFFNLQLPSGANYQEFYGGGTVKDWVKPRGVGMARFLLIGGGASGSGGYPLNAGRGGGSAAITSWIGPAIFIPDVLQISIGLGGRYTNNTSTSAVDGSATSLIYQAKNGTGYTLLTANGAIGFNGGTASSNNYFGAAGIYSSIAGETAPSGANATPSATTFLSPGGYGGSTIGQSGYSVTPNYGYPTVNGGAANSLNVPNGYFITSPVFVGAGGGGGGQYSTNTAGYRAGKGGIGCGGGGGGALGGSPFIGMGGDGGDGAAFVWSW